MRRVFIDGRMIQRVLLLCCALAALPALAHEVRPGYLELTSQDGAIALLWKAPMRDGYVIGLKPVLPEKCRDIAPPSRQQVAASLIERRLLDCGDAGIAGETIVVEGLGRTLTDVIVHVDLPGMRKTVLLRGDTASFDVIGRSPWTAIARDYLLLGIEHILFGVDHLLFVFGLLLIVGDVWMLVKTITAFTIAHSITLALATLGVVHVPQQPVEAMIALSIVFLAVEIVHGHRGRRGIAHAMPWLVAFVFGLLHGFGFAGALAEIGLPEADIPLALLFFNLGVEAGQLVFIAAMAVLYRIWRAARLADVRRWEAVPAYAIGCVASFWAIDRIVAMF